MAFSEWQQGLGPWEGPVADIYNERYNNIDEKVQNIINLSDNVSKIKSSCINILLNNHNMLVKFFEEYGYLFFYGQWGIFHTEDRLRYIFAQLELDKLTEFFEIEI